MAAVIPGGKYQSTGTQVTGTAETVILKCPEQKFWFFITSINAADDTGAASTLRLVLYKAQPNLTFTLFHDKVIPANDALNVEFTPILLTKNDELRATTTAGVHVVVNYISETSAATSISGS